MATTRVRKMMAGFGSRRAVKKPASEAEPMTRSFEIVVESICVEDAARSKIKTFESNCRTSSLANRISVLS